MHLSVELLSLVLKEMTSEHLNARRRQTFKIAISILKNIVKKGYKLKIKELSIVAHFWNTAGLCTPPRSANIIVFLFCEASSEHPPLTIFVQDVYPNGHPFFVETTLLKWQHLFFAERSSTLTCSFLSSQFSSEQHNTFQSWCIDCILV